MGLKKIIKKIVTTKPSELSSVERFTLNYDDTKEVGVLFSSSHEDNHKAITYFVKLLQKDGKKVSVLAYFEEKHTNPFDFRFDFFTKKDIDYAGRINSLQVNEFMEKKFDYLYCINPQPLEYFDFILQRSQARCRIGKYHPESISNFELMVDTHDSNDTVDLILQMLHYTKSLLIYNPKPKDKDKNEKAKKTH